MRGARVGTFTLAAVVTGVVTGVMVTGVVAAGPAAAANPGQAAAAPTSATGVVRWTLTGVPAQLVRGRTIDLGYVIQNASTAHVCIGDASLFIGRYFTSGRSVGYEPVEMPVSALNPVTDTWVTGSWASGNTVEASWWNGKCYALNPGSTVTIQVHVTVPADAPAGKYKVNQIPGESSDLPVYTTGGFPYYTMIGSTGSGGSSPAPTTSAAPQKTAATTKAGSHPTTAVPTQTAAPSPSALSAPSGDVAGATTSATTTAPQPTTTAPQPATATDQPTAALAAATTPAGGGGGSGALVVGIAGVAIVAVGSGTVLARRRRAASTSG